MPSTPSTYQTSSKTLTRKFSFDHNFSAISIILVESLMPTYGTQDLDLNANEDVI